MTMGLIERYAAITLALAVCGGCSSGTRAAAASSTKQYTERDALNMIKASQGTLAPVYAPLAEQIVADFDLADKGGVGIDVGSGPGTLILGLCERTRIHWINADINPHFFPYFFRQAEERGHGHRVSAVYADAQELPFRDNYADIIVSRGSFHFWADKKMAFREIYRVLKPGAVAYIGRGFSRNLPVETARKIRARQGGKLRYNVDKTADELSEVMKALGIRKYRIHRPRVPGAEDVNYGVWVEFRKR